MTRRRIDKKERYRRDLLESFVYLAERDLDVGKRFVASVRNATHQLADMPGMGALRNWNKPGLEDVRSWPITGFKNYLLFYRPIENGIEVLRVIHGARDIEKLFE